MKFFGEYLVEKGVVSEQAVVDALVEQLKNTPSVCEIIYHNKLLTNSDLLKVIAHQNTQQSGFIEACRELGLWTESIRNSVKKVSTASRVPLGQVLVNSNAASFDQIIHALDEFLSEVEVKTPPKEDKTESKSDPTVDLNVLSQVTDTGKEPEIQSMPVAEPVNGLIHDFCEIVNEFACDELRSFFTQIRDQQTYSKEECKSQWTYLHTCVGSARFIKAQASEKIDLEMEDMLRVIEKIEDAQKLIPLKDEICNVGLEFTDLFWQLRESLRSESSEESFFIVEENKLRYQNYLTRHAALKARLLTG